MEKILSNDNSCTHDCKHAHSHELNQSENRMEAKCGNPQSSYYCQTVTEHDNCFVIDIEDN